MSNIPEGWTDDLSIQIPTNTSIEKLTKFVIEEAFKGQNSETIANELISKYEIPTEDAYLILDRVFGGITRAATNNSLNRPNPNKDPFANSSYEMAINDKEIISFFFPSSKQKIQKTPWWKFWKK